MLGVFYRLTNEIRMRPQQQNRRMRGRGNNNNNNNSNNNNRKGPNPLSRSYESNGPDVKIRGSAQQIADKYTTLARDAQSVGDRVMAENYLQHAEHYNRIIAAAQAQQQQQRDVRDDNDDDDDDRDDADNRGNNQAPAHAGGQNRGQNDDQNAPRNVNGHGPQPIIEGMPAEVAFSEDAQKQQKPAAKADAPVDENAGGENGGEEAAPRRARRPRRTTRSKEAKASDAGDGTDEAASGDAETPVGNVSDQPTPEAVGQD